MTSLLLTRVRAYFRAPAPSGHATSGGGRHRARTSVLCGGLLFALATAGLAVAAESVKPEWRDPEYGHRLRVLRARAKKRPDQPLVLIAGSSRAQIGVSPRDMGFTDEPGQPFVYNIGYRGATPPFVCLQLQRYLDDGIRPKAVVVLVAPLEINHDVAPEQIYPKWGARMSASDLRRLEPYARDPAVYARDQAAVRRDPWSGRREAVLSDLLPDWQDETARGAHTSWELMDRHGAVLLPEEGMTAERRRAAWNTVRTAYADPMNLDRPGDVPDRALRDLIARCRSEGIAVAVAWAPESPAYRALYTPTGRATAEAYQQALRREVGVPLFPAPDHLEERDFLDGFHLFQTGAAKYSRWLADTHLKPWLAEALKK